MQWREVGVYLGGLVNGCIEGWIDDGESLVIWKVSYWIDSLVGQSGVGRYINWLVRRLNQFVY